MSEAKSFLKYFGSKRKIENTNSEVINKSAKTSQYDFSISKLQKYQKEFVFWNTKNQTACEDSSKKISWIKIDIDEKKYFCWVCQKYPSVANAENEVTKGTNKCHKNYLKRHADDIKHKSAINQHIRNKYPTTEEPIVECVAKYKYKLTKQKEAELKVLFNTSYWIAKEGLAFNKFNSLCQLQVKNGITTGQNYLNDVGCRMFIKAIAETLLQDTADEIKNTRFLSVLSDGSTDAGIIEQEIVYCRYVIEGKPVTVFLGIEPLKHAHAEGTLEAIESTFLKYLDAIDDLYKKGVNCNFDGASVMSGNSNGVRAKMQAKQEGMTYTHCIAHKLELCVLDSIKCDSYLEKLQSTISAVFHFYYNSPKKRREILSISNYLNDVFKQFGGLKNVRWVSSRHRALSIIEQNYNSLIIHQENVAQSNDKNAAAAKGHCKIIKSARFVFYIHFLMDFVACLKSISLVFQKDELLICSISRIIEGRISVLEVMKTNPGKNYKRLINELSLSNGEIIYKNVKLDKPSLGRRNNEEAEIDNSIESYELHFKSKFSKIIEETQNYIRKRFSDFDVEPLIWMKVFDFKVWPTKFSGESGAFGCKEVENLSQYYQKHDLITQEESELIPQEWPLFRNRVNLLRSEDLNVVFCNLLLEKDKELENILVLLRIMMTISPSTAACERGFSTMNREKTSLRTSLSDKCLDDIMRICINGVSLDKFDSEKAIEKWFSLAKKRHVRGHKLSGPRTSITDETALETILINELVQ